MSENNRSYRIRTDISKDKNINVQINNDYDILEILSLKISTENIYKLHTANYGCVVGRVLANGGVGVPNAKISIFIAVDEETSEDAVLYNLYPYSTTSTKNGDGIRYNLLPDEQVSVCHQAVGTMPNKRLVLDDKNTLEIFDKYYKYTTVTNNAGDYMIFGVPVGNQSIHMDVDLSDIGFLSQKPIDMLYKGYNITQFENAQQFKKDNNLNNLSQIISQNTNVFVNPFWGDEGETEISITRHDIDVDYKFEPTCIFMGSLVTDNTSNGFSKRCVPTPNMGRMDRLTTGSGTIEMIRKKSDGAVEEYAVSGTQLIDGNGTWCYQIPMNLDYVTTDEYGNIVPTDNPDKGLPTRTRVRFRISLGDFDSDYSNNHLVKVLVPNNPQEKSGVDYVYGTNTQDDEGGTKSFRDLFWNNVYTVKSYIPRIQKGNYQRTKKFSGIKNVNVYGNNNPIPYNNMRVNITFLFLLQCAIIKALIWVASRFNYFLKVIANSSEGRVEDAECMAIGDGLCPDLEGWYFAPNCVNVGDATFVTNTLSKIKGGNDIDDKSSDSINKEGDEKYCLDTSEKPEYFLQCVEINLAMENEVIQFDFYNDWINGLLYIPRWFVKIRKKTSFLFGLIKIKPKVKACMEDSFFQTRRFTQQCALDYKRTDGEKNVFSTNASKLGCRSNTKEKCHKSSGRKNIKIFGSNGGIVHNESTYKGQSVYYAKPCEWNGGKKCNLFATDIVLLGSILSNNLWGIPNEFDGMQSSTFQMPPNLVQTNMDSDGVLYAISGSGKYKCTSTSAQSVEKVEQTFDGFKNWVSDVNEIPDDDVDEYAVSEISGIDWGFSGPNQGGNNLSQLYKPGGHFLGIACANAEVNIKSCVNLSRICELGALMSQRQSQLIKKNNDYEYEYIIPSGLISKLEISDTNYRNIFATLNHNRLKTVINSDGTRKYDFISVQPINFGGELSNIVNDNDRYNRETGDNNGKYGATAYFKTIEDNSREYYYFRLGINNETTPNNVKKKYLINNGSKVSMPVYENSYYFYYGLKDGSTAIDRFLTDYYAQCPSKLEENEPRLNINGITNKTICGNDGSIEFETENVPPPYEYILTSGNSIIDDKSNSFTINTKVTITGLTKGEYTLIIKNNQYGISLNKSFSIDEVLPSGDESNFNENSWDITINDFLIKPKTSIKTTKGEGENSGKTYVDITSEYNLYSDIDSTILINELGIYNESKNGPYIYAIAIENDDYFSYQQLNYNVEKSENIVNLFNGKKEITSFKAKLKSLNNDVEDKIINITNISSETCGGYIIPWESGKYSVSIIYSCAKNVDKNPSEKEKDENFQKYEISNFTITDSVEMYDYYIYDENLQFNDITSVLNNPTGITTSINIRNLESLGDSANIWKIKKALLYDTAISNLYGHNIKVGVVNVKAPYIEEVNGFEETMNEDRILLNDTSGATSSIISNILIPTEPWMVDEEKEFKDVVVDDKRKDMYEYEVTDADGLHPLIVLTKHDESILE